MENKTEQQTETNCFTRYSLSYQINTNMTTQKNKDEQSELHPIGCLHMTSHHSFVRCFAWCKLQMEGRR